MRMLKIPPEPHDPRRPTRPQKRSVKIYLDDTREAPEGWFLVRWPEEAIEWLERGDVTHLSLDHDLGDDDHGTGYDVVLWLEEAVATRGFRPPIVTVHSANTSAREKMEAGIRSIERFAPEPDEVAEKDAYSIDLGDDGFLPGLLDAEVDVSAVQIDDLLESTLSFWDCAEFDDPTHAGIHAFDLRDTQIEWWALESANPKLDDDLNELHKAVSAIDAPAVESQRLNQRFERTCFLKLLEHLQARLPEDLSDPDWWTEAKRRLGQLDIDWNYIRAAGMYSLWIALQTEFHDAYTRNDRELIRELYDFSHWCCEMPRGDTTEEDMLTAVMVCFYEHIPEQPAALADMPNWWTREDVVTMKSTFSYGVGEEGFARILAAFDEDAPSK